MATGVQMLSMPSPSSLVHTNGADTEHEIQEYQKIIKLRDEIYAGKHPRFKPASQPGSVLRSTAQPAHPPSGPSTDKNHPPLGVPRGQPSNWPTIQQDSTGQITESQISDILLSKSDVLVNAEIKLKRQRIEKELRRQLEEKRQVMADERDLNLEEVMEKVGLPATRRIRPGQEDMDMQTGEPAPRTQGALEQEEGPEIYLLEAFRKPPTGPAAMSTSRDQEPSPKYMDSEIRPYNSREAIPERVYSPPARPHYSATSQLRSPAAPQPVRPANMARVESQDQRMIVEVDAESPYGRYQENTGRAPYRSRVSPVPYIKPEPASPGYREPAPRAQSPDRVRPPSRVSQYDSGGRARYDYPYVPPTGYYPAPPAPPPVPTHRPYDPYTHREADPYAYPPAPVDYARRSYTPAYVPPAYPPRPVYDDYDRRYPPPPQVPVRQPSRVGRRSASPPGPYRHPRHPSRSVSPIACGRRSSPRPSHAEYRPQSRVPSPPRLDQYGRPMPPPAAIPQRADMYAAEYGHPYAPPRERSVYGDERALYYPPPVSAHYNELPRPESTITAREADVRSYRDREYSYSATVARQSLPPPVTGSGYPPPPPPPFDYARAASRAASRPPMGPPTELVDYSRGGGGSGERGDYHDRPLARPEEREREYNGRTSTRIDERGGYPPARHTSVRPGSYGEREYTTIRQPSVRPEGRRDGSREQYIEPPPMMGFGARDPGQMQPPRLPYAGSEYGDSRYGGKY